MAILLWPLLSLLLCAPILVLLYRRDRWLKLTTVFAIYASILYAAGLVCFTLYPLPTGDSGPGITYGMTPILDPFNFLYDLQRDSIDTVMQLSLNVALFVPLGFIAKTLLKKGALATLGISFAATLLIEIAQLTGLFGAYPYSFRTFEVDDLICNTLGGMLGWALAHILLRFTAQEGQQLPPITHNPGFLRRCITLLTDALIIDTCAIIPRLVIVAGLRVAFGIDAYDPLLDQANVVLSILCYGSAFVVVEVVIPWIQNGATPAGMFYRMSCETQKRTGMTRVLFYGLRAIMLLALFVFLRYCALPFALFYACTRKMPYDFIPATLPHYDVSQSFSQE
ncbi:VanZ family protein [Eggerthellaceae bacterium 3-80]